MTTAFILGLGSIGLRHATNLRMIGYACVGFDPCADRRALAEEHGISCVPERDEVFSKAKAGDVLVIASPSAAHAGDLRSGIDADLHIFIEKPIAHTLEGLTDLIRAGAARGLVIYPGLNLRHHPGVVAAKALIGSGRLGTLLWATVQCSSYLPDWRPHQDYRTNYAAAAEGGGVILDIVHEFDLAWHLLGPYEVVGAHVRRSGELELAGEDYAAALLRHQSGVGTTLQVDYVSKPACRVTTVAGTEATITINIAGRFNLLRSRSGDESRIAYDTSFSQDYIEEMRHFDACVRGEAEPACTAEEAAVVLERALRTRQIGIAP
jgi:predicted dehydrogenase